MMQSSQVMQTGIGTAQVPAEFVELKDRIRAQPPEVRAELEPLIDELVEDAVFRGRAMVIASEALQRFRLDMAALRLDLEATRREAGLS